MNRIVIEKDKLLKNIQIVKLLTEAHDENSKKPIIIAVLKANAYGMGASLVGRLLLENGISFFAVAEVREAIELRNEGFTNDILILNATSIREEIAQIIQYDFIATVGSMTALSILNEEAEKQGKIAKCHLKIDTGFGRFGFRYEDILENEPFLVSFKEALESKKNIEVIGTYSHFQESYAADEKSTREQFERFQKCTQKLQGEGIPLGLLHICNSVAFFKYQEMHLDAVRIGSAFTGRIPYSGKTGLQRVGYLESSVCEIKEIKKGERIGYSKTYKLRRNTRVAIVGAGYASGVEVTRWDDKDRLIDKLRIVKTDVLRVLHHDMRYVQIGEKSCQILGRVGMNNLMIDVTDSDVKIGDKVKISANLVYIGNQIPREYKE